MRGEQQATGMEAFFMDMADGQRFCLLHTPPTGIPLRGAVVYVHPFAEEMNASRRMASLQSRALAEAGFAVLQVDLLGCGDSDGDLENATWDAWIEDIQTARQWMATKFSTQPWLWGLRAGCLLAAQAALSSLTPPQFLFWQPVLSGKQHLHQFLRLDVASGIARGQCSIGTAPLAQQLENGQSVEIAGYRIAPRLAQGMVAASLDNLAAGSRILGFELSSPVGNNVSPALAAQIQRWQNKGCQASMEAVEGMPFWNMQGSTLCPALIQASVSALLEATPSP